MRQRSRFVRVPRPPRVHRPVGDQALAYRDVRDVFERAEAAAREDGTGVTADHVALGVLRSADQSGATVLRDLGISEADFMPRGGPARRESRPRWGPELQPIFQAAADEARQLGSRLTRSGHVLLGLVASGQGTLGRLLASRGVTLEVVRERVRAAIAAAPSTPPTTASDGHRSQAGSTGSPRELFTVDQAAEFLGVHHQTLRGYIKSGKLPAYRLAGEKVLRIKREDLMALLEPVAVGDAVDEA